TPWDLAVNTHLPGPFAILVTQKLLDGETPGARRLLAALPAPAADRLVPMGGSDGLDSTRWPERHNLALAKFAAANWKDAAGLVADAVAALERNEDPRRLERPEWGGALAALLALAPQFDARSRDGLLSTF